MTFIEHGFQPSTKCFLNDALHDAIYRLIFILKINKKINIPYDFHWTWVATINQVLLKRCSSWCILAFDSHFEI
jgi:hypothetical protein